MDPSVVKCAATRAPRSTATAVCMKHCLSKSTLHRMVRRYYEDFPKKL